MSIPQSPYMSVIKTYHKLYGRLADGTLKHRGPFVKGLMKFNPNEIASIWITDKYRKYLEANDPKLKDAPFLKNGQLVRVTGLWSRKKLPFSVWPLEAKIYDEWIVKNGYSAGFLIPPEQLEKLPEDQQDWRYTKTIAYYGLTHRYENRELVTPSTPKDTDMPASARRKLSEAAALLGGTSGGGTSLSRLDEALRRLKLIDKHIYPIENSDSFEVKYEEISDNADFHFMLKLWNKAKKYLYEFVQQWPQDDEGRYYNPKWSGYRDVRAQNIPMEIYCKEPGRIMRIVWAEEYPEVVELMPNKDELPSW